MKRHDATNVLIIGAGLAGIATAYYLVTEYRQASVLLVDSNAPMSFTSAQSGDNYRNWWPHPTMVAFMDDSITLMERLALDTSNVFRLQRRGYALATRREDIADLVAELHAGYAQSRAPVRVHDGSLRDTYVPPASPDWEASPDGVDVLSDAPMIRRTFPSFSRDIRHVIHIRRAGDLDGQQLGQYMLEKFLGAGGTRRAAEVTGIEPGRNFKVAVSGVDGVSAIRADVVVNAAGPFAPEVARMLGIGLPAESFYQQKIAFEDTKRAIPRGLPFSIDLDEIEVGWNDEEREFLMQGPETAWLAGPLRGGAHCRPEGGERGTWVKLGWALNREPGAPLRDLASEPRKHPLFPEILMRRAARLQPSLASYLEDFPTRFSHYGGYYVMTPENWPLIGPLAVDGAYITGALSGFGTMAACAAGKTCAAWISGSELPAYAAQLSPARYGDRVLMSELAGARSTGLL